MKRVIFPGQRFGRLTVIAPSSKRLGHAHLRWRCHCDCGASTIVDGARLGRRVSSCGCYQRDHLGLMNRTHGMTATPEFLTWRSMLDRCRNPKNASWANYGARGISVCERWEKFENFFADMGVKPSPKLQIDRINNNGNYEPGNCRWTTPSENSRNRRPPKRKVEQLSPTT